MNDFLVELGGCSVFFFKVLKTGFQTNGNIRRIVQQMAEVSFRSLSTVIFSGFFVGAIMVLQFDAMLRKFDARIVLGGMNTAATIQEIGPLIISFLLAGKVGAFTAAELANMRVTEQIDAIECLGTDSIQYLIVPRFFAIIISNIILLMIGLLVSIVGSIGIAQLFCGMNPLQYLSTIPRFTSWWTLFEGFSRCAIYGTIVATLCCFKGYTATGGARGVGRAVTLASIYTNIYIVIANYFSGFFLDWVRFFIVPPLRRWIGV